MCRFGATKDVGNVKWYCVWVWEKYISAKECC